MDGKIKNINDAAAIIAANNLECLVWPFEECSLAELAHYVPKGKEELVVVCFNENNYLPYRLTYEDETFEKPDYVTLNFHSNYAIHIIMRKEIIDNQED